MKWFSIIYIPLVLAVIGLCIFMALTEEKDPNLQKMRYGHMSKLEYQGHSYVVWSYGLGNAMVHDPDCKCINRNN